MLGQILQFVVTAAGLTASLFAVTPKGYRAIRSAYRWAKRHVINDDLERRLDGRIDGVEAELKAHEGNRAIHSPPRPGGRRR